MGREDTMINEALLNIEKAIQQEEKKEDRKLALIFHEDEDRVCATTEEVTVRVAMDSGSMANVVNPESMPSNIEPEETDTGRHFTGAGGERIRRYGACNTLLSGEHGDVGCRWQMADVTMALHSVSEVTGPIEGTGDQDVLFNNKSCYVVPPGVVREIMKKIKPVAEYPREKGLYVAEMRMSAFRRQGQDA